jgi:hypothetical protein
MENVGMGGGGHIVGGEAKAAEHVCEYVIQVALTLIVGVPAPPE